MSIARGEQETIIRLTLILQCLIMVRIRYILVKQVIISKACRIVLNTWDIIPVPAADTSIH